MEAVRTSGRATGVSSLVLTRESRGKNIPYRASWGMRPLGNRPRENSLRETRQNEGLSLEIINRLDSVPQPAVAIAGEPKRKTPALGHFSYEHEYDTPAKCSSASSNDAISGIQLPGRNRMHGYHNVER
jgi:hypothetical protein